MIKGSGEVVPLTPESVRLFGLEERIQSPVQYDSIAEPDGADYLSSALRRDAIHAAAVDWGLNDRPFRRQHMPGHHAGGFHLGKNKRQRPSIRFIDEALQDPYEAAERFKLPMLDLYAAGNRLNNGSSKRYVPAETKR